MNSEPQKEHISTIVTRGIAGVMVATLTIMLLLIGAIIFFSARAGIGVVLDQALDTIDSAAQDTVFNHAYAYIDRVFAKYSELGEDALKDPDKLLSTIHSAETDDITCSIVSKEGVILASTDPDLVDKDLGNDPVLAELYNDLTEYGISLIQPESTSESPYAYLLGMKLDDEGSAHVMVGVGEEGVESLAETGIVFLASMTTIQDTGRVIITDTDGVVVDTVDVPHAGEKVPEFNKLKAAAGRDDAVVPNKIFGTRSYSKVRNILGHFVIAHISVSEVQHTLIIVLIAIATIACATLVLLAMRLSTVMKRHMVSKVVEVNEVLASISEGNLDSRVNVYDSVEFSQLSDGINAAFDTIEELMERESKRLDAELEMARTIQQTSLPGVFPPFPERGEFGLFASMEAARVVGGDFFDFYPIDDSHLAILVADVSEKGIPAAMFMMRAKERMKDLIGRGMPLDEAMGQVNRDLCQDNAIGMFVTVWVGVIDLTCGSMEYVHAGHTVPLIASGRRVREVRKRADLVVGNIPEATYTKQTITLSAGDALFLYSDGVTEAANAAGELYGMRRLRTCLKQASTDTANDDANSRARDICQTIRADVLAFVDDTPQSDDITMLCLVYVGPDGGEKA